MCNKMRTIIVILAISLLGTSLFTMAGPLDLTKSISQFSTEIYRNAIEGKDSNVIISPFSIHMAVTLALMGAKGKTYDQMLTGLRLSGTRNDIATKIHELIEPLSNSSMLKVANKVYVMENYHVKPSFDIIAKEQFHSEAQSLNFAKNVESAGTINKWVEQQTNDKIKNLIPSDALGTDTRMVLVNAIYFKGFWQHQFKKDRTAKAKFYTNAVDSVDVDMMHVKEHFRYGEFEQLDAKGIELPYKDSDMSMFIILPNERTGLAKLESDLKDVDLNELSKSMFKTEVDVSIPKFKIEFQLSMVDTLKKMGMTDMFSNDADFSDLLESPEPLQISDVIHKAFIDVNEEGAEAAAATAVLFMSRTARVSIVRPFVANHGFYFALRFQSAGTIFIGRKNV